MKYLFYLLRHKFWVFCFCTRYGLVWRGITHDCDKLRPSMFFVYVRNFSLAEKARDKSGHYNPNDVSADCRRVLLRHFHHSRHHWQYWLLSCDTAIKPLDMGETDVREMLCDWAGAGRAQRGKNWKRADVRNFYATNRDKMVLSAKTVELIEKNLDSMGF